MGEVAGHCAAQQAMANPHPPTNHPTKPLTQHHAHGESDYRVKIMVRSSNCGVMR